MASGASQGVATDGADCLEETLTRALHEAGATWDHDPAVALAAITNRIGSRP